jgi:hypothetical protein
MVSTLYVVSSSGVILKDELGSMWKENICLERFGERREKLKLGQFLGRDSNLGQTKYEARIL